jgi:hypothetical protein
MKKGWAISPTYTDMKKFANIKPSTKVDQNALATSIWADFKG